MGCTWISVASLVVLIFASFMANMKATEHSSTPSTENDQVTMVRTPEPTPEPTAPTSDQLSTDNTAPTTDYLNTSTGLNSSSVEARPFYRDFPEYKYYRNLVYLMPYITTIPGFITNSLTILVAAKIKPPHASEIYMIVLGSADLLTATGRFLSRIVEEYVELRTSLDCKLLWYIQSIGQAYSNMILVSWTIERFIAVIFPIKLASWCSVRNTKIVLVLLLLLCMLLTVPYVVESEIARVWIGRKYLNICYFSTFLFSVWYHVESVYYLYIPILFVCICNLAILFRLSAMTKARINMASNQDTIDKKTKENKKMTILLLTISGTFLLLHIPHMIAVAYSYIHPDVTVLLIEDPHYFAKFIFYTTLGFTVTEYQNSVNFFLYCLSGTKFRLTLKKMLCRHKQSKPTEKTQTSATRSTTMQ